MKLIGGRVVLFVFLVLTYPLIQELYLITPEIHLQYGLFFKFDFFYEDWFWFYKGISIIPVLLSFYISIDLRTDFELKIVRSGLMIYGYFTILDILIIIPYFTDSYSYGFVLKFALFVLPALVFFAYRMKEVLKSGNLKKMELKLEEQELELKKQESEKMILDFKLNEKERLIKAIGNDLTKLSLELVFQFQTLDKVDSMESMNEYKSLLAIQSKNIVEGLKTMKDRTQEKIDF